ncbi:MAG: hypothetical protein E7520_04415 [Ruminococcaceae bacterium]|nr:hypothetical protein [Oscillospiraceae bacterium]
MKNKKYIIIVISLFLVAATASIVAFAGQENNYTVPCEQHSYKVMDFSDNTVFLRCEDCDEKTHLDFADLVGAAAGDDRYVAIADVNHDGVINGRDLAHLKTEDY